MNTNRSSANDWLNQPSIAIPTGKVVRGTLRPPSSKSVSHRMMNLVMLSEEPARIRHLLGAEDLDHFCEAFRSCGWTVSGEPEDLLLVPPSLGFEPEGEAVEVFCGNAGTMFRFLVATRCVRGAVTLIDGTHRLRERPIEPLVNALCTLGARIEYLGEPGCAPLRIYGGTLRGGRTTLDAGQSSQYLSALLMACGFLDAATAIDVEALVSTPYVAVTLAAMRQFGVQIPQSADRTWQIEPSGAWRDTLRVPRELEIEADFSAAAYPAAAAMISGGAVKVHGLDAQSVQGDRKFLEVLVEAGGEMQWINGTLRFSGRPRRALDVDLGDMPDQVPTLAAVAAFCPGTTRIRNVAHLRVKESDRLRAIALEWTKIGITVNETSDGIEIEGRPEWLHQLPDVAPCEIATYDDHRIAMSAALVGIRRSLVVSEPKVVAKSYPAFWVDLFELLSD